MSCLFCVPIISRRRSNISNSCTFKKSDWPRFRLDRIKLIQARVFFGAGLNTMLLVSIVPYLFSLDCVSTKPFSGETVIMIYAVLPSLVYASQRAYTAAFIESAISWIVQIDNNYWIIEGKRRHIYAHENEEEVRLGSTKNHDSIEVVFAGTHLQSPNMSIFH